MTPIVSDTVKDVPVVPNVLTLKRWVFGTPKAAPWKHLGNTAPDDSRKRSHPNHPTMTVIAGIGANRIKLSNFMQYCPSTEE
jgi:hypothetical protein